MSISYFDNLGNTRLVNVVLPEPDIIWLLRIF